MNIDFNDIAKSCYDYKYDMIPATFENHEELTDANIQEAYKYLGMMEDNENYVSFRDASIELLKTVLTIAHLKRINLNDFFRISVNFE